MESFQSFYDRKLRGYTLDQYIVMFVVSTLFLPYYFSMMAMIGTVIYACYTGKIKRIFKENKNNWWLIVFFGMIFTTSIVYKNVFGVFGSIGLLVIMLFVLFYRSVASKRLFTFIVDMCCIASILCFLWGLLEYNHIVYRLGYPFMEFIVENAPENRINSTFFNANFYAMMIQFLVLMCTYKILYSKTPRRIIFYSVTILCNLFALYLTGCRSGWLSFCFTLPLMFLINKRYRIFILICLAGLMAGIYILFNPTVIPRFDNIVEYFFDRTDIWITAMKGIQESPIFGKGPSTYFLIYEKFGGPKTQHAHSVYLDPILSFGFAGLSAFVLFLWTNIKEVGRMLKYRVDLPLLSVLICFVITVYVHGIFDYTIYWIQTGTLFFIVFGSSVLDQKAIEEKRSQLKK